MTAIFYNLCKTIFFDHKGVYVNFFKTKLTGQRTTINAQILKDPIAELLVKVSVAECYTHHVLISNNEKIERLNVIGEIRNLIKTAGPDPILNCIVGWDEAKDLIRANNIAELTMMLDDIDISTLESLDMDIEKDLFLEYLVNCVRNDVASFQIFRYC